MSEKTKILYFPRARTALKFGLKILGLNPNDHILIPDFICDSIFQPITQNSLTFSIYGTSEDMKPIYNHNERFTKPFSLISNNHY